MRSELLDNLLSDARVQEILQQSEVLSWASQIEPTYTYGLCAIKCCIGLTS